jgi:DNA-binding MarR family transcriptional regulator
MSPTRQDDALLALARGMIGLSTRAADELGQVSVVQLRALTMLRQLQPASLVQLAEGIGVTPSTTSRLVDRLVAAGFVERRTSPESRRQIELRLSPEGEATLDRYDALRLSGMAEALEQLPEGRREVVLDALAEFGAALCGSPAAALP